MIASRSPAVATLLLILGMGVFNTDQSKSFLVGVGIEGAGFYLIGVFVNGALALFFASRFRAYFKAYKESRNSRS